jgi:hypothetical protein
MKSEQEWLDIYHKFWKIYGNNNVRLILGQFEEEINHWGKIEIVGYGVRDSLNKLKELINLAEKHNLRISFGSYCDTISFYENYEEQASSPKEKKNEFK